MRLIALTLFMSAATLLADDVSGRWEGVIAIPGRELSVAVYLAQGNAGQWQGSAVLPPFGISGAALDKISVTPFAVSFSLKSALADQKAGPAKFNGQLESDGTLAGDFMQGGNTARFRLAKAGPPQLVTKPHSSAIAKELEGEWHGEYELFGYPRKVTIKLQNRGADGATAEFVIVGRKVNNLPVDLVRQESDFVTVASSETGLSFEGQAGKDGIKGTILQGAMEVPVVMKRAN
jgi:hypothetical protein